MKGFAVACFCGLVLVALAYVKIDKIELLDLHNAARSGVSMPLTMSLECDEAAQSHADWMAARNNLDHFGERGSTVAKRLRKKYSVVGENIAAGQRSPEEVTRDWLDSVGHRRNIIDKRFKYVGFGISKAKNGTTYWCAVFSD